MSLEVVSKDKSYDWILKWINLNLKNRAQHINVETYFERNDKSQRIATSFSFIHSAMISLAPFSASATVKTSAFRKLSAFASGSFSYCFIIIFAKGSRPFSMAAAARVFLLGFDNFFSPLPNRIKYCYPQCRSENVNNI